MNEMGVFLKHLTTLSDEGVLVLHRVYAQGWPKFGLPIHLRKRDLSYAFMLIRIPRKFEMECDRMLQQLHISLPQE